MKFKSILASLLCAFAPSLLGIFALSTIDAQAQTAPALSDATVLIIRYAEKPPAGNGLTAAGQARAEAYAKYFEPFNDGAESFNVDALYAASDTTRSARPTMTLGPLKKATGLPIDTRFGNFDSDFLAQALRTEKHGKHVLVAWQHNHIAELIRALGASTDGLLRGGKWPDEVYDWVIELKFDKNGKLAKAQRIQEKLP